MINPSHPTFMLTPHPKLPPNGPLTLGSILSNPLEITRPLNKTTRIAIPEDDVYTHIERDTSPSYEHGSARTVGVWSEFLASVLGVGADVGVGRETSVRGVYHCRELETVVFAPSGEYLAESLGLPAVKPFLQRRVREKSVYMVTGLMIARGVSYETEREVKVSVDAKVGFDGAQMGVPVKVGPRGTWETDKSAGMSVGESDDFVLAYQLIKIRRKRDDAVAQQSFNKFALWDDNEAEKTPNDVMKNMDIESVNAIELGSEGVIVQKDVGENGKEYEVVLKRS